MASLIDELITTLNLENEIYEQLLPVAKEKKKIIVNNDLVELQAITEVEQKLVEKINPLEHKREEVVSNIGMVLNLKKEQLHITKIIETLENQPESRDALDRIHKKLKKTVNQLVELNTQNQKLIKHSLEMLEFNMNFIQSTRNAPENNGYTRGANRYQTGMPVAGLFDAKQ